MSRTRDLYELREDADTLGEVATEWRKIANHALEHAALDVTRQLSLPSQVNVTPAVAATAGLEVPGEIDLLVADPATERLWVCEVKDLYAAVSPQTMARRVDKFAEPERGFVNRLDLKRSAVASNPTAALRLLGAPNSPCRGEFSR